jgi:hypothetical protein
MGPENGKDRNGSIPEFGGKWDSYNKASLSFLAAAFILPGVYATFMHITNSEEELGFMSHGEGLKISRIAAIASLFALLTAAIGIFRRKGNVICGILVVVTCLLILACVVVFQPL